MKKIIVFLSSLVVLLLFSNTNVFAAEVYQGYKAASNWRTVDNYITQYLDSLSNPIAKKDYTKQVRFGYYIKEDSGLEAYRERVYILPSGLDSFDEIFLVPVRTDRIIHLKLLVRTGTRYMDLSSVSAGKVASYSFRQFINPTGSIRDDIHDTGIVENGVANLGLLGDAYLKPQTFEDVLTVLVGYMGDYTWVKTVFQNGENIINSLSSGNYDVYDEFPEYDESIPNPTIKGEFIYTNDNSTNFGLLIPPSALYDNGNNSFSSNFKFFEENRTDYQLEFFYEFRLNCFNSKNNELVNSTVLTSDTITGKQTLFTYTVEDGFNTINSLFFKGGETFEHKNYFICSANIDRFYQDYVKSFYDSNVSDVIFFNRYSYHVAMSDFKIYCRYKNDEKYGNWTVYKYNWLNLDSIPLGTGLYSYDAEGEKTDYSDDVSLEDILTNNAEGETTKVDGTDFNNIPTSWAGGLNINNTIQQTQTFISYLGQLPALLQQMLLWIPVQIWTLFISAFTVICAIGVFKALM